MAKSIQTTPIGFPSSWISWNDSTEQQVRQLWFVSGSPHPMTWLSSCSWRYLRTVSMHFLVRCYSCVSTYQFVFTICFWKMNMVDIVIMNTNYSSYFDSCLRKIMKIHLGFQWINETNPRKGCWYLIHEESWHYWKSYIDA